MTTVQQHIPTGFQLVPTAKHMTPEQSKAIRQQADWCAGKEREVYAAMVNSAPKCTEDGMILNKIVGIPKGYILVPISGDMTDDQGEAVAMVARCCGGIAYSIYSDVLAASPLVELSPKG